LQSKRVVLVLDNCGRDVDEAPRLAEYLFVPAARLSTKSAQAGLFGIQFQSKPLQSQFELLAKANRIAFALETRHEIIRVAHDDHVAGRVALSQLLRIDCNRASRLSPNG
jgi:hypothetical protein